VVRADRLLPDFGRLLEGPTREGIVSFVQQGSMGERRFGVCRVSGCGRRDEYGEAPYDDGDADLCNRGAPSMMANNARAGLCAGVWGRAMIIHGYFSIPLEGL
jgi:hypothetical protein